MYPLPLLPPLAVPSSSVGSSSMESSSVNSSESDERLEGVVTLIMASTVFLRLIQAESRLMTQIIPTSHHKVVLDELTKRPIEFFMRDGEVNILILSSYYCIFFCRPSFIKPSVALPVTSLLLFFPASASFGTSTHCFQSTRLSWGNSSHYPTSGFHDYYCCLRN